LVWKRAGKKKKRFKNEGAGIDTSTLGEVGHNSEGERRIEGRTTTNHYREICKGGVEGKG